MRMIVCEIGNIPPHSVPVVIREIVNEDEDEHLFGCDSDEDDPNSSENLKECMEDSDEESDSPFDRP